MQHMFEQDGVFQKQDGEFQKQDEAIIQKIGWVENCFKIEKFGDKFPVLLKAKVLLYQV